MTNLLSKFLSVDFITDIQLSKKELCMYSTLYYTISLLDISILTAIIDIPELPGVIDSLIKTYQSKFL